MMRIISVVGLNSGQDEDEQDQQLEVAGSGKAQASVKKNMSLYRVYFLTGSLLKITSIEKS